jgi:hypothetical protein
MAGDYAAIRDKKTELIRKARDGSVFCGPITTTAIATITTGSSAALSAMPTGMVDIGWTTTDGVSYSRTTETSDIRSFGSVEPTRSDVTSDEITMAVTMQETSLMSLQLYTGADLTAATATVTTSEFHIAKPALPGYTYYRVAGLFVDIGDTGEIYVMRYMPRARVTEFGEQQFNDADEAITYPVTFTGYEDSTLGYSHKWFFGGPGWKSLIDEMGITQGT